MNVQCAGTLKGPWLAFNFFARDCGARWRSLPVLALTGSAMCMQWLTCQRQVRLAESFSLGGMSVDQLRYLSRVRLPVVDELRLPNELADPRADHVHADDGAIRDADQLDEARCLEDLALPVARQVVRVG